MSDTTSINAILSQRVSAAKSAEKAADLKLVEIPKALEHLERPQVMRGQVTQRNSDGTITIKTDKGEIKAKIEQNITVQKGDNIEIKINKGHPPQGANVRLAPNLELKEVQYQNLAQINQGINITQNLSAEKLVALDSIKVDLLTPQLVQKITNPYIDKIDTTLNLTTIFSILPKSMITENLPLPQILTQNLNDIIKQPISELFLSKNNVVIEILAVNQKVENIDAFFKMAVPKTEIPLRMVLTQIIVSPLEMPVTTSVIPLATPAYSAFSEISISDISPPLAQVIHGDSAIPEERAGETRAVLAGFTMDKNLPILKIITPKSQSEQHYALQIPVEDITLDTQLKLNIIKSTDIIAPISPQNMPIIISQTSFITPEIWQVMQGVMQVLTHANPKVAKAFGNVIPNLATPAQLGSAALFFLTAMRSGDAQSWLGSRAVEILKNAGKAELVTRLGAEFSALSRISSDGSTAEWRTTTLPLAWQNDIHKMEINYRKEYGEGGSESGKGSGNKTRFVMDLNLSNIGKLQLDGLFIGNPEGVGRLDLILRTEKSFSEAMKMEMRQKYKAALDETSFTGELAFQNKPEQWVSTILEATSEFSEEA